MLVEGGAGRVARAGYEYELLDCYVFHALPRMSSFESHFQSEDFMPDASAKFSYERSLYCLTCRL